MDTDTKYYLVERTLLPEVFRKVVKANAALHTGRVKTASEAAQSVACPAARTTNIRMASVLFMRRRTTAPSTSI